MRFFNNLTLRPLHEVTLTLKTYNPRHPRETVKVSRGWRIMIFFKYWAIFRFMQSSHYLKNTNLKMHFILNTV